MTKVEVPLFNRAVTALGVSRLFFRGQLKQGKLATLISAAILTYNLLTPIYSLFVKMVSSLGKFLNVTCDAKF